LPFRGNIPEISAFAFDMIDRSYAERAKEVREAGGHVVVGGNNYGQGSSREHAALAPRFLGLRVVLARSFARIHWQNLINFGILPLTFGDPAEYEQIKQGDRLRFAGLRGLKPGQPLSVENQSQGRSFETRQALSPRQIEVLSAGGLIPWMRRRL
jgi:aconitate hydratase